MRKIFTFLMVLTLTGCSSTKNYILSEKDLIPEGVAYNTKSNIIYVGSIYKQKVIGLYPDNKVKTVIPHPIFKNLSPLGMEMDNNKGILWMNVALAPIVNQSNSKEWQTTIMSFDIAENQLIKMYNILPERKAFLNDLTISEIGKVYATESVNARIYTIDKGSDRLKIFTDLDGYSFPNGITSRGNNLFVATNEGILKIDIETKRFNLIKSGPENNPKAIDGLAIYKNYFIGHQSSKISKFYFNMDITEIEKVEILDDGDEFDSSTTGEIGNGYYHYIVNSQIKSGIDVTNQRIKPLDSLERIIIRSIKI